MVIDTKIRVANQKLPKKHKTRGQDPTQLIRIAKFKWKTYFLCKNDSNSSKINNLIIKEENDSKKARLGFILFQ